MYWGSGLNGTALVSGNFWGNATFSEINGLKVEIKINKSNYNPDTGKQINLTFFCNLTNFLKQNILE